MTSVHAVCDDCGHAYVGPVVGGHRVLHGDATKREDYGRLLGGEPFAGLTLTDPPYGVDIAAKNRALDALDKGSNRVTVGLDGDRGMVEVERLWRASFPVMASVMAPGSSFYVFGPQGGDLGLLLLLLRESSLPPRHILIWVKNRASFSIGRLDYDYQHEPIVYGWAPGGPHPWHAEAPQTSILQYDRPARSPDHPTVKPVDLLERLITNSAPPGGSVLDPFGGSGSTLIAAHRLGRRAFLLEIDRGYVDVIVRRFAEHSGFDPVRQDGIRWSEAIRA